MAETPPKVLIVDDDPLYLKLTGKTLQAGGYILLTAPAAEEGIREARRSCPDLIILDVQMPGMDGIAACSRIKADPELKHIPVIMHTATQDPKLNEKAFKAGAAATVVKGSNPASILSTVRLTLASGRPARGQREGTPPPR